MLYPLSYEGGEPSLEAAGNDGLRTDGASQIEMGRHLARQRRTEGRPRRWLTRVSVPLSTSSSKK